MKKKMCCVSLFAGLTVFLLAGAAFLFFGQHEGERPSDAASVTPSPTQSSKSSAGLSAARKETSGKKSAVKALTNKSPRRDALAGRRQAATNEVPKTADQRLLVEMQDKLDSEDFTGTLQLARRLMKSKEPDVRSDVVAALGWIGVKALPELSSMLGDEEEDVARQAYEQWKNALDEVEDNGLKAQMLTTGMLSMTEQDSLEECVMDFGQLPDALAVKGLLQVIQSNNSAAAEVAQAYYEDVTGDEYTTPAAAEQWIKDNASEE